MIGLFFMWVTVVIALPLTTGLQAMRRIFSSYRLVPATILHLMLADVFLQLINSAFTLLLNYMMLEHGFRDYEITSMVSNRYLTVLICSFPLALVVKGRRLKPFMLAGSIASPVVSLLLIWAIHLHNTELIRLLMALWGMAFSLLQILVMPYILLNGTKESEPEAIALFFAAGNFTLIICGFFNWWLPQVHPFFSIENLMIVYCSVSLAGIYFTSKLPDHESLGSSMPLRHLGQDYDWQLILRALVPTFLIAFGAGFTIPFINLFFKNVHGMEADTFSLMNILAFALVVIGGVLIPAIKRKMGYKFSIIVFQLLAIIALFALGTTEWFRSMTIALPLAAFFFIIRQPLMNIAAPLTSELTMAYVGENNREMISALASAIWSGSWFASAKIFSVLRESNVSYSNIIFITVLLYIIGVAWYYWLIVDYERRKHES